MLSYDAIAKILKEHSDVISGKDKTKAEKFLQAYYEKDCDNMERIVKYWEKSNNPILSLLNLEDSNGIMKSPIRKTLYKSLS